jgi:hypothetical protein
VTQLVADTPVRGQAHLRDDAGRFRRDPSKPASRRRRRSVKLHLITRDAIDQRSNAYRLFQRLAADIEADLGGRDQLSTIEITLIEAYVGAAVTLQHLNTRLALGEPIDLSEHAQAVSAMVRVASRLGLRRRAREIEVDPLDYAAREDASS